MLAVFVLYKIPFDGNILIFYHLDRCYYKFLGNVLYQVKQISFLLLKYLEALVWCWVIWPSFQEKADYILKNVIYTIPFPVIERSLYWTDPPTYKKRKLWMSI